MTRKAVFQVALDQAATQEVSIDWATVAGTAAGGAGFPGDGSDFASASGTLTFAPGETQKSIEVIVRDADAEAEENFSVVLSNPVGCTISDATGVAVLPSGAAVPTKTLLVQDSFKGVGTLQAHTGELNAQWAMLYGDDPLQVGLFSNELRKPTFMEDPVNCGGESNLYLTSADFDSTVSDGVSIEFDLKRGSSTMDWFVALYREGDNYGNMELLTQIGPSQLTMRTASGESSFADTAHDIAVGETQKVRLVVKGAITQLYMNDALIASGEANGALVGKLGWALYDHGDEELSFSIDNLEIYALGEQPEALTYSPWNGWGGNAQQQADPYTFRIRQAINPERPDHPVTRSAGKYALRFAISSMDADWPGSGIGFIPQSELDTMEGWQIPYPGSTPKSWVFRWDGSRTPGEGWAGANMNELMENNGVVTELAELADFHTLKELCMEVDFDTGKIWVGVGGTWLGGGDPAAGTNPLWTLPAGETWRLTLQMWYSSDVKLLLPNEFTYPATAGFTPGWPD